MDIELLNRGHWTDPYLDPFPDASVTFEDRGEGGVGIIPYLRGAPPIRTLSMPKYTCEIVLRGSGYTEQEALERALGIERAE